MSKLQLIEAIQGFNRTARPDFLVDFDEEALTRYLRHLQQVIQPRGGQSMWRRAAETHSIVTRTH